MTAAHLLDQAVLSWPSARTRRAAHKLIDEFCSQPDVVAVVVFGSAVRGSFPTFDLDVLCIYRSQRPSFSPAGMDIDLRCYSIMHAERLLSEGHDLISWAVKFGKVVCEKQRYWSNLVSQWRPQITLPSVQSAEQRAEKAHSILIELESSGDYDAAVEQLVTYLTHRGRIRLIEQGVYPASRPELPDQLRAIGAVDLASALKNALDLRSAHAERSTPARRRDMLKIHKLSSAGSDCGLR